MIRSTFQGFTTAHLALSASQTALNITGQNISNVNTAGYCRQNVDFVSANFSSRNKYAGGTPQVGHGVLINSISQNRNPFLDIRFRNETSKVAEQAANINMLDELENIFDEISSDGLGYQMGDFVKQLQSLSREAGSKEFDDIVRASAQVLTGLFHQYGNQIGAIREQTQQDFEKTQIPQFNNLLQSIESLSQTIRETQLHGGAALELLDQRNLLLDQLSQYAAVKVSYQSEVISPDITVENLKITFADRPDLILLDKENGARELTCTMAPAPDTGLSLTTRTDAGSVTQSFSAADFGGGCLKSNHQILRNNGEFDTPQTSRGIGYYEKLLDNVAGTFAKLLNKANTLDPGDPRPLFETSDGSDTFTAKNLTVSKGWANSSYGITCSREPDSGAGKNDNVLYMISLFSQNIAFKDGGTLILQSSLEDCFGKISTALGLEKQSATKLYDQFSAVQNSIADARDGVSSVSLDEEGVQLLQFQKSYNAAARLMTTLDEALDTLINRMGVVGR